MIFRLMGAKNVKCGVPIKYFGFTSGRIIKYTAISFFKGTDINQMRFKFHITNILSGFCTYLIYSSTSDRASETGSQNKF